MAFYSMNLKNCQKLFDLFQVLKRNYFPFSKSLKEFTVSLALLDQRSTIISDSEIWVKQWATIANLDSLCDGENLNQR